MKTLTLLATSLPLLLGSCSGLESNTGISGKILEAVTDKPILNVEVSIGNEEVGWTSVMTDSDGIFEVMNFDLNSTFIRLNGMPASKPGHRYPSVKTRIDDNWIQPGEVTILDKTKWLPVIDETTRVDLTDILVTPDSSAFSLSAGPQKVASHPASDGWWQIDPTGEAVHIENDHIMVKDPSNPSGPQIQTFIYYDFQPGTYIKFPEGEEKAIAITQIDVNQLPHELPEYVTPETMVASSPGGTFIDPPVQLHFGALFLEEGGASAKDAWSLSHTEGLFFNVGRLVDATSDRGAEYASKPGEGLSELGWHGPVTPPPCNDTNFYAKLIRHEDGTDFVPDDETVTMAVGGRGFRNVGERVETGSSGVGCQASVVVKYRSTGWESSMQTFTNRGVAGSSFCVGTYTIDIGKQTVTRSGETCQ